jgi:hypothetical protein
MAEELKPLAGIDKPDARNIRFVERDGGADGSGQRFRSDRIRAWATGR